MVAGGLVRVCDERERLDGLAQSHVVGEDPADPVPPQHGQPVQTLLLVGPQVRLERGGDRDGRGGVGGQFEQRAGPPGRRLEVVGQLGEGREHPGLTEADLHARPVRLPADPLGGGRHRLVEQLAQLAEPLEVHRDEQTVLGEELVLPGDHRPEDGGERDGAALDGDGDRQSQPVDPRAVVLGGHVDARPLGGPADARHLVGQHHVDAVECAELLEPVGQHQPRLPAGHPQGALAEDPAPAGVGDGRGQRDERGIPGQRGADPHLGHAEGPTARHLGVVGHAHHVDAVPLQHQSQLVGRTARARAGGRPDRQLELHAIEPGELEPPDAVGHREPVDEVGQEVRTELGHRLVGDGQGAPLPQLPGHAGPQPPDRGQLQHPVTDQRDHVPVLPHEGARQGAVAALVVVVALAVVVLAVLGAVGSARGAVRSRLHLRRGDHHQRRPVRTPRGEADSARRPGHDLAQAVAGHDLHLGLRGRDDERPQGGDLGVAQVEPHARLAVTAGERVDRPQPRGLGERQSAVPAVAQPVPLDARRLPAPAAAGHHDPRLEPVAQPRLQAARAAVRGELVGHHRQLQPDDRRLLIRPPRVDRAQGLLGLAPPVGHAGVPVGERRRVQHDRGGVLAVQRDGARAQAAAWAGVPVRVGRREVDGRRVPGAAAPAAAARDVRVEAVGGGVVPQLPDARGVGVAPGAAERRRAHEGGDVGLGNPRERCLHAVRLEDDDDETAAHRAAPARPCGDGSGLWNSGARSGGDGVGPPRGIDPGRGRA